MPQKSHKKIKKEQKTKVKVKSSKTELPKGQNVTDTSFKVRKIQLKEQFPGHDDSESTPGRKLNIKVSVCLCAANFRSAILFSS